jgi:hypothetical protein
MTQAGFLTEVRNVDLKNEFFLTLTLKEWAIKMSQSEQQNSLCLQSQFKTFYNGFFLYEFFTNARKAVIL